MRQPRSVGQHLSHRDGTPIVPPNDLLAEFRLVNVEQAIHRILLQNPAHLPDLRGFRFGHAVHVQVGRLHVGIGGEQRAVQKQLHVAFHERQVGVAAVAHGAPHDLLNAVHVVPRLHDVHLAHVLEVNALAACLGNNDHLDALPVLVVGCERLQLGAIVGGQLLVAREHGVLGGEPFFRAPLLESLRDGGGFKQRPHLRVVPREPHFFQGQRNGHRAAANVFAVNQDNPIGPIHVVANAGDFAAVVTDFCARKDAPVFGQQHGLVFKIGNARTIV